MIRIVMIALVAMAVWLLLVQTIRFLRTARIDWTGVTTMVGFIIMAFYLRHVTGMG